ncbi:universal stress protein [Williamsia deligens]|uniref:Universal stress protein n=1 Tax=Williamsia deligens TaxID=321325 RepID=A0ABW3G2E6_9NOCA|nr:universal stress protein [Williamsia deligens]MCP2194867.1 Nucleotide-binding universal stress protein, UspA family [Williamsia deligens]
MTLVVGYHPERGGTDALALAALLAHRLGEPLVVTTVVPTPWTTPSMARVDAEFEQWAQDLAAHAARTGAAELARMAVPVDVDFRTVQHKSVSGGLLQAVADSAAHTLVLGSADGPDGEVSLGSTGDRLLHSSSVALAVSPRGFSARSGHLTRITCAYAGTPESRSAVAAGLSLAGRLGIAARVVTFAVRGRTMYPPEAGLHAEDVVLAALSEQSAAALHDLRTDGVIGPGVDATVVTGGSWRDALDAAGFAPGEILVLGTSPRGPIRRVFLGSRAAKIVRSSPVPVLVVPG